MPVSTRIIKRRIKSVTSTKKITKAMELVSAAKMRKAVQAVLSSRPYSETAWAAVTELAQGADASLHPLLRREGDSGRELVVFFASDRGLCGGFVSQVTRTFSAFMADRDTENVDVVTIGRKAQDAAARRGWKIIASFTDLAVQPRVADLRPVAKMAMDGFVDGQYDRVWLCFTDYRSALVQKPLIRPLLPIGKIEGLGEVDRQDPEAKPDEPSTATEYLFEPDPSAVLEAMLPRLVESQIYQAVLESSASEYSARMMAMRSATDAATEMIDALTLTFNQARQAGITAEIAEISSGKAALES